MNFKTLLAASALVMFGATANADFIIDLEGQVADPTGLTMFIVNNADSGAVTEINFDFTYDAGVAFSNGSWGSELVIELAHIPTGGAAQIGTQDEGCAAFSYTCQIDLAWADAPGIFTASGTIDLGSIMDGSGDWQITIGDSFNDLPGIDGIFRADSNFTIVQEAAAVPVPGTMLLIGIGIAGMGIARRRFA